MRHCERYDHPQRERAIVAARTTTAPPAVPPVARPTSSTATTTIIVAAPNKALHAEPPKPKRTLFTPNPSTAVAPSVAPAASTVAPPVQHVVEHISHPSVGHLRVPDLPLPRDELEAVLEVAKRRAATAGRLDPCLAWMDKGVQLVGPFAKLLGQEDATTAMMKRRGMRAPPETEPLLCMDALATRYYYHRDTPTSLPGMIVASTGDEGKFDIMGTSVAALLHELTSDADLVDIAHRFRGDDKMLVRKRRAAQCIAKTVSGLGIVVPYDKKTELGYREPMYSSTYLATILSGLNEGRISTKQQHDLDEQIQFADIANDECDFGLGLQLGLDFFTKAGPGCRVNEHCGRILSMAYTLLGRDAFDVILKLHFAKFHSH